MNERTDKPRFMMDHMVIRLGKYLRALGYDAIWAPDVRTHELILAANRDSRVFVTRNRRIPMEYPLPRQEVLVSSDDPVEQLYQLAHALDLDFKQHAFSRCIRCNVPLAPVPNKETVRDRVHPNVWRRYSTFYVCPRCGTLFWKGSHVRNTCRKLRISDCSDLRPSAT